MKKCWWENKSKVSIVVDNDSWIIEYAKKLTKILKQDFDAVFINDYNKLKNGDVAFFLGCVKIAPKSILVKNTQNLIVHESDLPKGRGFSPVSWEILNNKNKLSICLLEAGITADSGKIIFKDFFTVKKTDLINDIRAEQGKKTIELCLKYLYSKKEPVGISQKGKATFYKRRKPIDSEISINKSIKDQFNLLRIVDNKKYPAFFKYENEYYEIKINKITSLTTKKYLR